MPEKNIQPYSKEYNKFERMELAESNTESTIINIFYMSNKVEENMSMWEREVQSMYPKGSFKDEKIPCLK